jgi:hypothetical protein
MFALVISLELEAFGSGAKEGKPTVPTNRSLRFQPDNRSTLQADESLDAV